MCRVKCSAPKASTTFAGSKSGNFTAPKSSSKSRSRTMVATLRDKKASSRFARTFSPSLPPSSSACS